MYSADQILVKKMNRQLVLAEIIKNTPISRVRLSEITGLNKSTISSQVAGLMEDNLIFEIGQGHSSGGRRPVMLVFNKNAGYTIGVDIGVDYLNVVLTDLSGNILLVDYSPLENSAYEAVEKKLFEKINLMKEKMTDTTYGLVGIGVGVPGLVDNNEKIVFTPNSKWRNINLKGILEKEFGVPVVLENEANAGAFGEKRYGAGKSEKDIIYVSVNVGIGIGIILGDQLQRGVQGFSGEMGHMTIDFNGPKCTCGNKGCWELYASEHHLFQLLMADGHNQQDLIDEIRTRVSKNDIDTLNTLENFGFYLGIGLVSLLNIFNPETVIIRNSIVETNPLVLNSIQNTISARMIDSLNSGTLFKISELKQNATALGASSIIIQQFLAMK